MSIPEENDTNSEIFASLKHPVRRRILRLLSNGSKSFSDLQKEFGIESSHMSYHLDGLGSLVYRTEDGRYALSRNGETAFSIMEQVEKTQAAPNPPSATLKKNRKYLRLGRFSLRLWPVGILMILIMSSAVLGYYLWPTFTVPLEIKEPIEIIGYPSQWSLYPGESAQFNITIRNHASLNYSVVLDFETDNMAYQSNYIAFSNENYTVVPGQQNLEAWLNVSAYAPAANLNVTVTVLRAAYSAEITAVSGPTLGTWSSGQSFNVTLPITPKCGDVLICAFGETSPNGFDIVSSMVEANGKTTWTKQVGNTYHDVYYFDSEIWYGTVDSAGASKTITITLTSANAAMYAAEAYVSEYSGLATSNFLDKTAVNQGVGVETDSGTTATTTQSNELWIASIVASAPQSSPTNGFTLVHYTGTACDLSVLYTITSATGMANTGTNMGTLLHDHTGCIATFFAAGSASSG